MLLLVLLLVLLLLLLQPLLHQNATAVVVLLLLLFYCYCNNNNDSIVKELKITTTATTTTAAAAPPPSPPPAPTMNNIVTAVVVAATATVTTTFTTDTAPVIAAAATTIRRDFQTMVYYNYCRGTSFQECFQSVKTCFSDQLLPKATVFKLFRWFVSSAKTLEDSDLCSRTATTVTTENVSRVESLLEIDPKMTYAEIQHIVKISSTSLTHILHYSVGIRKSCEVWSPTTCVKSKQRVREDWCTHMLGTFGGGRSPRIVKL